MTTREVFSNRMYIPCRTLNRYTISTVDFKMFCLYMTILTEEGYGGYWYTLGTKRYKE